MVSRILALSATHPFLIIFHQKSTLSEASGCIQASLDRVNKSRFPNEGKSRPVSWIGRLAIAAFKAVRAIFLNFVLEQDKIMTEVQCLKIRFRRDKIEEALRWVHSLKERQEEVAQLLDAEGVRVESLFLERLGKDVYLYQYVRANSLEQAYEAFMNSQAQISVETRQFIDEMWEDGQSLELIADFERS
jgi:hypothetical protein